MQSPGSRIPHIKRSFLSRARLDEIIQLIVRLVQNEKKDRKNLFDSVLLQDRANFVDSNILVRVTTLCPFISGGAIIAGTSLGKFKFEHSVFSGFQDR